MTLDLRLSTRSRAEPEGSVSIAEALLWELPGRLGVRAPLWERVGQAAMDDPVLGAAEVADFAAEVRLLRDRLAALRQRQAIDARRVSARAPEVRRDDAARLVDARDPEIQVLDALLALCAEAVAAGCGIYGLSD